MEKSGFTLLEVLIVIVIIGILSAMAYSSFMDMIFTSRAKETAQTIRTFAERALAEGKRQNDTAFLKLISSNIEYKIGPNGNIVSTPLSNGFSEKGNIMPECEGVDNTFANFNSNVKSKPTIGLSSLIPNKGYFVACDAKDYCGAAVKAENKNSFIACIRRGSGKPWEALL